MIQSSSSGIQYFFRGISLLSHPKLRNFVILPLLINVILFSLMGYAAYHYFNEFVVWFDQFIPSWLQWLNWLLWLVVAVSFLIVSAYIFTLVANLIAAPFNALLSEKVEELITGETRQTPLTTQIADVPRSIGRAGLWLLYYIPRALLFLLLFLIPGVNVAASVLWFIFNSWVMAVQYGDYPMDNHRFSFAQTRQRLGEQRGLNLGFGAAVLVCTLIPFINFIAMPAAVVGATLLWCERNH